MDAWGPYPRILIPLDQGHLIFKYSQGDAAMLTRLRSAVTIATLAQHLGCAGLFSYKSSVKSSRGYMLFYTQFTDEEKTKIS